MASISKEILIRSSAEEVWAVIGDFAAGPSSMAPGYVVDTRVEADTRVVTFIDGTVARERFVALDHENRRIVYAVVGDSLQPAHDNASMQVLADGEGRCRLIWIHDVLPDDLAPTLDAAMTHGSAVIKRTFEDHRNPQAGRALSQPARDVSIGSRQTPGRGSALNGQDLAGTGETLTGTKSDVLLPQPSVPAAGTVLNPFVIVDDAAGFIDFVSDVFGVEETAEARTPMPDGKLIHAQLRLGNVDLMIADRLDGWPLRPGLLQVWVRDVATVLQRAGARGATTVTAPTAFYGEVTLGRMLDSWQNIWWLYAPAPGQPDPTPAWDGGSDVIFATLDKTLKSLAPGR
jgi:PhnB protein